MNTEEEITVVQEISKGEAFKMRYGYSRTFAKNMKNNNCSTPAEYKAIRKKNRAKKALEKRNKHMKAIAGRKAKVIKVGKKGKKS